MTADRRQLELRYYVLQSAESFYIHFFYLAPIHQSADSHALNPHVTIPVGRRNHTTDPASDCR